MGSLTDSVPKPMLRVAGKTLLEHKFDILDPSFDEIILVVGYQGEVIRSMYGTSYKGIPVRYIEQETLNGTMGALALAHPYLTGRFVVMMGDDIYSRTDLVAAMAIGDWTMLLEDMAHMAAGGRIITDADGAVVAIEEGDHRGEPGLFNTNLFVLDPRVFDYPLVPKAEGSTEYGLPQTVLAASMAGGIPLRAVHTTLWIQITSPEDIERAEARIEDTAQAV
jgi:NDP-sugar pyrophosphorylase family protein